MFPDSRLVPVSTDSSICPSSKARRALLDRASALQHAPMQHPQLLRGMHLGLMSACPEGEDAQLFVDAARALGAHVSQLPVPSRLEEGEAANIGRVLSQLYDAVECQGLKPGMVEEMALAGQFPIYQGLAERQHWISRLAEDWQAGASLRDRRQWLIEAALLASLL